jgi:hypothetical protein
LNPPDPRLMLGNVMSLETGPRQFAISLTNDADRKVIPLSEEPKIFGRILGYVDVCLLDVHIAKMHFTIQWNAEQGRHEVQALGGFHPLSLNGSEIGTEDCRVLSVGDVIAIGPFKLEYIEATPGLVDQTLPAGSVEISRTLADRAQQLLTGCEACDVHASVPFDAVLDRIRCCTPGTANYILRIPITCNNCRMPITEKTQVVARRSRFD